MPKLHLSVEKKAEKRFGITTQRSYLYYMIKKDMIEVTQSAGPSQFTFQTYSEYCQATRECSEFTFNCVRIRHTYKDGQTIGSCLKTFEDYKNFIEGLEKSPNVESYHVYPVDHDWDQDHYL